jgi:hypothetical protein
MKIRTGFVSNSSTTSFCIYGVELELSEIFSVDTLIDIKNNKPDIWNEIKDLIQNGDDDSNNDNDVNFLEGISPSLTDDEKASIEDRLTCCIENNWNTSYVIEQLVDIDLVMKNPYDCQYYIGEYLTSMRDDQTYGDFKEDIKNRLEKVFGKDIECSVLEEAWR